VEELVSRSERGRKQMHSDLGSLRSGPVEWPEEPPIPRLLYGAYLWVKPAVQCIREAVGAWTLVEKGWPEWRRKNVLQFISSHDPDFCPSAREAYFYKSTLRGRARFRRLIAGSRAEILGRIEVLTEEIDSFCQRAIAKVMDGEEGLREVPSGISCRFLRHPVLQPTS
jgi:hypothetical protein